MQHLACPQCGQQLTIDEPMLPAACGSCGAALNATTHSFEPGSTAESPAGAVGVAFQSSSMTRPEELVARRAKFGPYRIVRYIAEGGFGRVFEAVDERTGRSVALKLPRVEKFPAQDKLARFLEGFREEGRRAVELEHPAILKVLEVLDGDDVTLPAIVMEFVTGGTLLSRSRSDSRPTLVEAVEIMAEIAEAVHAAHLRGIVHRDLKPANILLTETGRPLVTDFGLALREEEQYARRGEHAGTLQYMSPEQINRRVDHLDGRSDIWSLSVMLYELLAGRRPFVARTNDELVEAIKNQPARPLRQRNASIDAELDELCLRGLRKAPEERPASAGEFAAALRRWLARHRESSSVKPAAQLNRRRLLVASLAAGSLAAIVGCFLLAAGRNAGGEQKPRVLDGLAIEGQALPLLRHRPVDVVPPAPPPATSWSFDSSKQQLEINSLGVHGVVLGVTRIADFDLSVRIQKNVWSGECGVFFGGESRFDEEDAQEVVYQSVSWYGADTGMARVERKLIYFVPTNGVLEYSRSHSFAEVVVARPAAGGGVEMSVKVRDGRVTAVSWDGQSLDLDDDSIAHRLPSEAPAATGKIGLVNFLGVSSFSKAEFTYQRGR